MNPIARAIKEVLFFQHSVCSFDFKRAIDFSSNDNASEVFVFNLLPKGFPL